MVKIHFLNVGHGDCTVIEHASGRLTVIDVNNGDDLDDESLDEVTAAIGVSTTLLKHVAACFGTQPLTFLHDRKFYTIQLTNPIDFLGSTYHGRPIFRYVQTHPDLDHMRGLAALDSAGIPIQNIWDTTHQKDGTGDDWEQYRRLRNSVVAPRCLRLTRDSRGEFFNEEPKGTAGGDGLYILAPTAEITSQALAAENYNNLSYVLMFEYAGVCVVLGGDAERLVWESIVEAYPDHVLQCDILKASHHGRDSGYHEEAVCKMNPDLTVVSVGKKPDTDASSRYRKYGRVLSTRWCGDITVTIGDDGVYSVTTQTGRG